ncbi:hypothetical protein [Polaribacter tangerinus]|uniref:hypothetical protein n=1 Tax=Polaribacter tangerinus TaxID=1920034 RepID=UPI000B4BC85C|nr:hypothetical protein [Polaribacter tangerinus]
MQLTKEQLLQIDNYIYVSGIKYYDVRAEIVDHFANILENKLDENPTLDFKSEIRHIHKNFSKNGFSKLLKEKTNNVQKQFFKMSLKHFWQFFKLPKIIISGALFYVLYLIMNWFSSSEDFFGLIIYLYVIFVIALLIRLLINRQTNTLFLKINMNNSLFQFVNLSASFFAQSTTFRNQESYANATHNNIHLVILVLLILCYWSCAIVYQKNKKEVQKQYPNIVV